MHIFEIDDLAITRNAFSTVADEFDQGLWFKSSIKLQEMSGVPSDKLHKRLEQVAEHVEQLHLHSIFEGGFDKLLMFTSSLRQCCVLRELLVAESCDRESSEESSSPTKGDLLLDALTRVPSLELLKVDGLAFSCPHIVERFLAKSPKVRVFHMNKFKTSKNNVHQVADGFRRGLQLNQTLTEVSLVRPTGVEVSVYDEILLALIGHVALQQLELQVEANSSSFKAVSERSLIANTASIKELRVKVDGIAAAEILHGLAQNKTVERFHMKRFHQGLFYSPDREIDSRLASAVNDLFTNNVHLRELKMEKLKLGPLATRSLAEGLSDLKSLRKLYFSETLLHESSEVFYHASKLESFSATFGGFWDSDFNLLRRGIEVNPNQICLQELNFRWTPLSNDCLQSLSFALDFDKTKEHLRKLNLLGCQLDRDCSPVIADIIQKAELKELNVSENSFTVQGFRSILESVRTSAPSMQTLHICNALDPEDEERPDDLLLEVRGLLEETRLVDLDVSMSLLVDSDYMQAVAEGLRQTQTVQKLLLPNSSPQGFYSIGQALAHNTTTTHLSFETAVDNNDSGDVMEFDAACSFLRLLGELKGLKELSCDLDWWDEDSEETEQLEDILVDSMKRNTILELLDGSELFDRSKAQFYVRLNRFGRRYLEGEEDSSALSLPDALWPHVFAKMRRAEHASERYYFLRRKISLLSHAATGTIGSCRKRKSP